MTFRCAVCNKVSEPDTPAFKKVLETREKVYPYRSYANLNETDDPGGKGVETVKEVTVCKTCKEKP